MKKYILISLVLMLSYLTASAQNRIITITLRNGTELRYSTTDVDSVKVLEDLNLTSGVGVKVYFKGTVKSKDYLAQSCVIAYEDGDEDDNRNRNIKSVEDYNAMPTAWRLEYPHLGTGNYRYSVPTSTYNGKSIISFTVEWDCDKKSNHWTCYRFDADTPDNDTGRYKGDFMVDPNMPATYQWTHKNYTNSGFSRGHMCMSDDRQYNEESNKHTFYTTNIHPQLQNHNGVLWLNLEEWVNSRGYSRSFCDTLYVVKAGTIDKASQIMGYTDESSYNNGCTSHILIPKYFYMCVLAVKNGSYKAIGFWTEHTNESIKNANPFDYAKSIDEIEELTGIDFFCNLPDDIEESVESGYKQSDWQLE